MAQVPDSAPGVRLFGAGVGPEVEERFESIPPPNLAWGNPVFRQFFGGSFRPWNNGDDDVYLAVGGGRLYVSSESGRKISSFDAQTLQPLQTKSIAPSRPLGISYYRDEIFVLAPVRATSLVQQSELEVTVKVFSPDLQLKREFPVPAVSLPADELNAGAIPKIELGGIDVAWNEIWIHLGPGLALIVDAQTGVPKGIHGRPLHEPAGSGADPNEVESFPYAWPNRVFPFYPSGDYYGDGLGGLFNACYDWHGGACPPGATYSVSPWLLGIWSYRLYLTPEWAEQRRLSNWRDVSMIPEIDGVLDGRHLLERQPVQDLVQTAKAPLSDSHDKTLAEGTDDQWGMRHVFSIRGNRQTVGDFNPEDDRGTHLVDEALYQPSGAWQAEPYRSMPLQDINDHGHKDVVYNYRGARVEWSGDPTTSEWLNGQQTLEYIVSDADVYVVGNRGEHYYELARLFDHAVLTVDGRVEATSNQPQGTLAVETERREANGAFTYANGVHTLKLTAYLTDGTSVDITNSDFRIDHDPPTGEITQPAQYAYNTVSIAGTMEDLHKGPKDWALWTPDSTSSPHCRVPAPGPYACDWNSRTVADGPHTLRATLTDAMTNKHPNQRDALKAIVVDNNPPNVFPLGELWERSDYGPVYDSDRPVLGIEATDAGSGVKSVEVLVDGNRQYFAELPCGPGQGCSLALNPSQLTHGDHEIRVIVRDQLADLDPPNHIAQLAWHIYVEKIFATGFRQPHTAATVAAPASPPNATTGVSAPRQALAPELPEEVNSDAVNETVASHLPCTSPKQPTNFAYFSVGPTTRDGLPVTAVVRRCYLPDPTYPEDGGANDVTYVYGDCDATGGEDSTGCFPPLQVQTWPACERSLADYESEPGIPYPRVPLGEINGVPAFAFDDGTRLELYTGRSTVVIFGHDPERVRDAAEDLQEEPLSAPTDPVALPSTDDLPDPLPGALKGNLPCVPLSP